MGHDFGLDVGYVRAHCVRRRPFMLIRGVRCGVAGLARLGAIRCGLDIPAWCEWSGLVVAARRDGVRLAAIAALVETSSHDAGGFPPIPVQMGGGGIQLVKLCAFSSARLSNLPGCLRISAVATEKKKSTTMISTHV